jgi:hypothetical protein
VRPEAKVEKYMHARVAELRGEHRRVKWVGRCHAPDDLIKIPGRFPFFVECKAPGEKPRAGQLREHERLRRMGFKVFVVSSELEVDMVLL